MARREWQGDVYDRISGPMQRLAEDVLARLPLAGGETALDAGCGSGRVTELLLERLPQGRVFAVDESESMAAAARRRLGGRAEVVVADLLELELPVPLDAVLSTATFHWIGDHPRLFARLRGAMRAGARLAAQCGGEGNISRLRGRVQELLERAPYARHFVGWEPPWNYAGAEETRERLLAAGFAEAECWLEPREVTPEEPGEFLSAIVLGPHVQRLPDALRGAFVEDALALAGIPVVVDYVRLNIDAIA